MIPRSLDSVFVAVAVVVVVGSASCSGTKIVYRWL